ncbi:IQ motif and ankyrin repeat domain-containing protein 1 [Pleodorina starrii]|uniref:IQ motif and ankyrin repeat domain-containing protein 1 n=1 Tax=Pleodorina starrii TaxID=330485 RepID=A0A9W6C0A6_9CHLO|nr:IQ motif and ankyrin repeat domain-containing protein 1 [Pleodorina starrii]GLC61538.1 IQ motif and ankyrin repeat domain-containing protein 1 [Pleodorina starrii]GLC76818.1 IQ motif and ankyrin repeat domain-containing protein 1 [Pleodorina starrii]
MVSKDGDTKATTPKKPAVASAKPAGGGSAAPRAAASPSRLRAGAAAKPAAASSATASSKPPAVKPPASSKPASTLKSPAGAAAGAGGSKPSVSKTAPIGKATSTSTSTAKAGAKGSVAKGGGKATASRGSKEPKAERPEPVPDPGPDPAEEAARQAEMEAKAAAEMEQLRRAAWQAQVEYERKQEAKRRQQREEEAKRKKEEAALRKSLLEAAYDGEDEQVRAGLARAREAGLLRPDPVETADGHGNTLLSEAAAGGALSTVGMLLQLGADPNSRGEFQRTPLWRAAFLGKEEVVPALLQGGADPRIGNEGGELPEHVAPAPLKELFRTWDLARTDQLLQQFEARRLERAAAVQAERAQAVRGCEESLSAAEEAHSRAQQALKHARMELEKRIHEYDTCVVEKKPESLTQVALDQIHVAEVAVEEARRRAVEAAEALDVSRLRLRREQQQQLAEGGEEAAEALPGVPVAVRALNDVLIRDVGGLIAASGKWPLVIDSSGQASVFLRYQDTNYVNALNSRHLEPNMLRRSLLGALRYGKAMVLDLQDCDLWPEMPRMFDQVQPGLLAAVLNKSLLAGERYTSLIRPEDGEEYDRNKFQDSRIRSFAFIVLTAARQPNPQLVQQMYALRVMISE